MKLTTWITFIVLATSGLIYSQAIAFESDTTRTVEQIQLININKADAETLMALPGVGRKKAEAIVAYRELNGSFTSKEEIENVKGIGKKMLLKIADKINI